MGHRTLFFPVVRWTILVLAILAQVYLFRWIRGGIRASHVSARVKTWWIYAAGAGICLLFLLNGYQLLRPVRWVDPPLPVAATFYLSAVWAFGSLFSAVIVVAAKAVGVVVRLVTSLYRRLSAPTPSTPFRPGRRRFLRVGIGGLAAAPVMLSGYGAAYAARTYEPETLALPFGRTLRVVQLTDIHAGLYMSRTEMRRFADQAIGLDPDVVVLTGDFISNSRVFLPGCVEEMARIRARYGTFATLGNHEHWYGRIPAIEAVFREHGIPVLTNAHVVLETPQGPFAIVGIDDLLAGDPDLDKAMEGLSPAIPTLLLSHRPEIFPEAALRRIPLTLSGHYHGGQVTLRLPGGDFSLAHMRTPYPEGLYRINNCHLYVSRGVGTTFTPIRLNAPPEVTLFRLT